MKDYPKPVYPQLPPGSISSETLAERLQFICRAQPVKYTSRLEDHVPGYDIKEGQHVLLVLDDGYEPSVVNALQLAITRSGAHVDTVVVSGFERGQFGPAGLDGSAEARRFDLGHPLASTHWWKTIPDQAKYDLILQGEGGPIMKRKDVEQQHVKWKTAEQVLGEETTYPRELQLLIDKKVFDHIQSFERVRITDPEGTDITFTNYKDGLRWNHPMHHWGKPLWTDPDQEDLSGVIAGTSNHVGFYPHVKVFLKGSIVVKVEGGGKFGTEFNRLLKKYEDISLPKYKDRFGNERNPPPSYFYYWEQAIGTSPKIFRPIHGIGTRQGLLYERERSGYIHHGFGPSSDLVMSGQLQKAGLPTGHLHVHTLFSTYTGETKSGEKVNLIEKGHLTVLDDPDVRKMASKFGDPDKLLKEAWFPAIPGINCPGNYESDYAKDPAKWAMQEQYERFFGSSEDRS